ncbi:unnamed protein product [Polarella glacialis]|uniref:Mei2-like C-terminal RNA recognition motif domain-containing protein n=1 Tax=Polarella glacialis TaxID=89957 RepID=A0A813GDL7_POLGL|nr:unnamed protein product [Polarella glacialis]
MLQVMEESLAPGCSSKNNNSTINNNTNSNSNHNSNDNNSNSNSNNSSSTAGAWAARHGGGGLGLGPSDGPEVSFGATTGLVSVIVERPSSAEVASTSGNPRAGLRPSTTLMLRNLPVKLSRQEVLWLFDSHGFQGCYDFVSLPGSTGKRPMPGQDCPNLGYCFINLLSEAHASRFRHVFDGFHLRDGLSHKTCQVEESRIQGLQENLEFQEKRREVIWNANARTSVTAVGSADQGTSSASGRQQSRMIGQFNNDTSLVDRRVADLASATSRNLSSPSVSNLHSGAREDRSLQQAHRAVDRSHWEEVVQLVFTGNYSTRVHADRIVFRF